MKFLLPRQQIFFDLLMELNASLTGMASLFGEFVKKFGDFEQFSERAKKIENEADAKAHEIVDRLNQTFITPFDREDIYVLTQELDDIVDLVENVIQNINIYRITEKKDALDGFAELIILAARDLDNLMKHFQWQKHTTDFKDHKVRIHELEDRGDILFQRSIRKLFSEEKDPVAIIKWKDILENLEKVMDAFQDVSNTIENIIVKSE